MTEHEMDMQPNTTLEKLTQINQEILGAHQGKKPLLMVIGSIQPDGRVSVDVTPNGQLADLFFLKQLIERQLNKRLDRDVTQSEAKQ